MAELILERGGDYVFVVEGNQPGLLARLKAYHWEFLQGTTHIVLNRERIETRMIEVVEEPAGRLDFPGAPRCAWCVPARPRSTRISADQTRPA